MLTDNYLDAVLRLSHLANQMNGLQREVGAVNGCGEAVSTVFLVLSLDRLLENQDRSLAVHAHILNGTSHDGRVAFRALSTVETNDDDVGVIAFGSLSEKLLGRLVSLEHLL